MKYVLTLDRTEFTILNCYQLTHTINRKIGKKCALKKNRNPYKVYIVVRKGKNNTLYFERQVAQIDGENFDIAAQDFKASDLQYHVAEKYEVNGLILATAKIVKIRRKLNEITLSELEILAEPLALEKVGLKRIPRVFSTIKKGGNKNGK